ncbi:hypothetical protein QBC36DRAFT_351301 [Triangularia setosa]|uniref:Uncharacterized protein n=1 Tax=Triangularia setosa TaxID=2587417 RepID=A0AAN6WF94_9PEZI|nr:hypothetical protein QBC36DRAFT_351301 [Podospora setosa]
MPAVGRCSSLLFLLSTAHGPSNTTILLDLSTAQSDDGHWSPLPPSNRVVISEVNRLCIFSLPLPILLSFLLSPTPIATPGAPLPVPTAARGSPSTPQGNTYSPQLTPQIGDAGILGGLFWALNISLSLVASLADVVPILPLPLPVSPPDFSSLASSDLASLSSVPPLVSEHGSTRSNPPFSEFGIDPDVELAAGVPRVGVLTLAIAAEVMALVGETFSGTSLAVAAVPALTVELPSLTMAIPVASGLSELPQLLEIPLSELLEVLSQIVGPSNVELVSSVIGVIASTLDGVVLSSEVQSLADAVTVVGGSSEMLVTQEWCSWLIMVDGNVVVASTLYNASQNTAMPEPTADSAPYFTDVPFAGLTIPNLHTPSCRRLANSDCNTPCPGDAMCDCGGDWAMSLWNADGGEVPKV